MFRSKINALLAAAKQNPIDWMKISEGTKVLSVRQHWVIHDYGLPRNWFYRMEQLIEPWARSGRPFAAAYEPRILDAVVFIEKFGGEHGLQTLQFDSDYAMHRYIDLRSFRHASRHWQRILAQGAAQINDTEKQTACMTKFLLSVYGWCIGHGRDSALKESLQWVVERTIPKTKPAEK